MASKHKYAYPSDKEIIDGYKACKFSYADYALALEMNKATLESYIRTRVNLKKELEKIKDDGKKKLIFSGEEVSREETLAQENKELRSSLTIARSESVKEQRIVNLLEKNLKSKSPRYKPKKFTPGKRTKHEFVLQWSDVHAAEVVSEAETNGANKYDWDIMLRRHDEIRQGLLSYQENRPYPIEVLHILGLGDLLSGNIHEELAETNEMPFAEATVQLGLDAAEWIESLVPHFKTIKVAGVVGNHPRLHKKQPSKRRYDNGDWVCYQVMRQRLAKHTSIEFDIPKPQKYAVEVCGKRLLLLHGDGIRSTMVDVPWGGGSFVM